MFMTYLRAYPKKSFAIIYQTGNNKRRNQNKCHRYVTLTIYSSDIFRNAHWDIFYRFEKKMCKKKQDEFKILEVIQKVVSNK